MAHGYDCRRYKWRLQVYLDRARNDRDFIHIIGTITFIIKITSGRCKYSPKYPRVASQQSVADNRPKGLHLALRAPVRIAEFPMKRLIHLFLLAGILIAPLALTACNTSEGFG